MISIVVVYNDKDLLNEILLYSLNKQTADFEFIGIDNTSRKFKSAAEALNYGGKQASGKYIMFVHQDVELDSDSWLEKTENILDGISDLGIAGVAGMKEKGKNYKERMSGYISDAGKLWEGNNGLKKPEEVQTLDECLMIIPKKVFEKLQFDEKIFDGWHCYGANYCLSIKQKGLKAYVIPMFVYHRSLRINTEKLFYYQKKLYKKHRNDYKHIYTTCGEVSKKNMIIKYFKKNIKPFYEKVFPSSLKYLKKELSDCSSVLDLGCGYNSPIQYCNISFSVGVEMFDSYLAESKKKKIHNEYIKNNILDVDFPPKSFDAVLCLEVLEHLTKEEGIKLINKMEKWAKKKIIITTPNGYLYQDGYDNNPLQEHKSGWNVDDFKKLGFNVFGINGWKKLRGYKGEIKFKPKIFWIIISDITQKVVYYYSSKAFQLFAIKKFK